MVSSASVFSISCTSKPGKEKGSIGEKKNLISGDNLSSTLLFFFLYEPDAQWLSTKSGEEPGNWYHHTPSVNETIAQEITERAHGWFDLWLERKLNFSPPDEAKKRYSSFWPDKKEQPIIAPPN